MLPSPEIHLPSQRTSLADLIGATSASAGGRLLVRGEPGLGKTTLLESALTDSSDRGVRLLLVRASERNEALPHSGLIDLFDTVSPAELDLLPPAQRDALDVALSRRAPTGAVLPLTLRVAVCTAIVGLLEQTRLAVVVDDWSLLDEETSGILEWVFTRPGPVSRASLIATERAEGGFFRFASGVLSRALFAPDQIHDLSPLGATECVELLARAFGDRLAHREFESIARLARGNPLWALEIAHSRFTIGQQGGRPRDIPGSIAELLMTRVEALDAPVADVLAVVSALGECSVPQVLRMIEGSPAAVDDALDAGVVVETRGLLRLAHPLLGKASMASLTGTAHRHVHARAAENSVSTIERASHLDKSVPSGSDATVADALDAAAHEARRTGAPSLAAALAARALERTPEPCPAFVARTVLVAETAFARGDHLQTIEILDSASIPSMTAELIDRSLPLYLDSVAAGQGEAAVIELLERCRARFAGQQPQTAIVMACRAEITLYPVSARRSDAEQALAVLSLRADTPIATHRALRALVVARLDAGDGLDSELLDRLEQLESRMEFLALPESALALRGLHSSQVDDHAGSAQALETLIARADELGDEPAAGLFSLQLAAVAVETGEPDRARRLIARFDASHAGSESARPSIIRIRGLLAVIDGDQTALTALLQLPGGAEDPAATESVRLALAGLFAARSEQWSVAVPLLRRSVALSEASGVAEPARRLWCDLELGEGLVALGLTEEAAVIAARLRESARRGDRPLTQARALRLSALIRAAGNDLEGAEELLRAALDLVTERQRRLERARITLELGRVARRRRARAEARSHFQLALTLATACGDRLLTARVQRELDRFRETAPPGELTAAEQRVAAAVLAGDRNSDIAATQFMSPRTVEAHLSAIYRKFNVHSRIQLVAELGSQNQVGR